MTPPADRFLAQLVASLVESDSLDATVEQVVHFARETVGADQAGLTLIKPKKGGFDTLAQTDQVVWDLDELQHELREGPCVDAAVEGRTLWSGNLDSDARWPRWGRAAVERGMRSILSIELHAHGYRIGAMNLYADTPNRFGHEEASTGRLFAYHAATALAAARREEDLEQSLDSRTRIGQAQGILMERFGISTDQAFNVLRRYSQDRNIRLVQIARTLVDDGTLDDLDPDSTS